MNEPEPIEPEASEDGGIVDKISGLGQKIIGEIESIGGILTGDPNTAAEGEFNIEVGDIREHIDEDVDGDGKPGENPAGGSW